MLALLAVGGFSLCLVLSCATGAPVIDAPPSAASIVGASASAGDSEPEPFADVSDSPPSDAASGIAAEATPDPERVEESGLTSGLQEGDGPDEEAVPADEAVPAARTVVCIGDSITSGNVPTYAEPDPWPTFLQLSLDGLADEWTVVNLGVTDTTLLDEGRRPYRVTGNVETAKQAGFDVALVMLGTNDSWDASWNADAYRVELRGLVDELLAAQPQARVVLMAPPSVFCDPDPYGSGVFHMNDAIIGGQIAPIMQEVAMATGSQFVDLHAFTAGHPEWFPDTVHPNGEGNRALAARIFDAVFSR